MARIVVVGPHPDDQELGMGGTIVRLARQGHHVLLLDMTNGEPTPLANLHLTLLDKKIPHPINRLSWRHLIRLKSSTYLLLMSMGSLTYPLRKPAE